MKQPDIEHEGIITGISDSHVFVRITQRSACAECHAASWCTTADQKEKIIEVEKGRFAVQPGDKVIVSLTAASGYKALIYTAILPLIFIILTLFIASTTGAGELYTGLCALVVLTIYYTILYLFRNRLKKQFTFFLKQHLSH